MIKNFKLFSESILWYDSGKFVKDDNFKLPERKYSPAEQWFLEQITDLEKKRSDYFFPRSIFFIKNGEVLFEYDQKFKFFWCDYGKIWSVLETEFDLKYEDIGELIKSMVEEHLNFGRVIPTICGDECQSGWTMI